MGMKNTNNNASSQVTLSDIDFSDACISSWQWANGSRGVVRPVAGNRGFAVIELGGRANRRIVKVLPTEERARAYNLSCGN
jgi:hypothetical protein